MVTLKKEHIFCPSNFAISHHLQELLCMLGQVVVFSEASGFCDEMLKVNISSSQIHRVSKFYGGLIDPIIEKDLKENIPKLKGIDPSDNVYVMVDGSM